ncbi:MAG: hypothetical protein AB8G23_23680 [Myxococcota bacterium]
MTFGKVLAEVMEEDDGLVLRLSAFERMVESRPDARGWTARWDESIQNRSRKIMNWMRRWRIVKEGK